jgi:hypothetical protein
MGETRTGSKVAIAVAVITVIGSLLVAIINKWDFSSKHSPTTSTSIVTSSEDSNLQPGDKKNDTLINKPGPSPESKYSNIKSIQIRNLVDEANNARSVSIEKALEKYKQAYNLLPKRDRPDGFIEKVDKIHAFETRVQLLDSFFNHLN